MQAVATVLSSVIGGYASKSKTPKIAKPKEQPDPNSLTAKRNQQRTIMERYGNSGRESTDLTGNSTLG